MAAVMRQHHSGGRHRKFPLRFLFAPGVALGLGPPPDRDEEPAGSVSEEALIAPSARFDHAG